MDRAVERRFLAEIETQCGFVARAEQDLSRALAEHDTDGVWYDLQMILIAAANVSKLLVGRGQPHGGGGTARPSAKPWGQEDIASDSPRGA